MSGDDGEDSFHRRLKEELEELEKNPDVIEPQLQKCSMCKEFNGKECNNRWQMESMYRNHPEWEQMDKECFEKRITDASDCWNFEEIDNEGEST